MTVLSLQWLLARPRRRALVIRSRWPALTTRRPDPARRPARPQRRTYPDPFFADPAAVEDDSRRMQRWLGSGRPPEELQLDIVGITEGENGVGGVGRLLDSGVAYPELVQPRGPGVKITAPGDEELQVIQPDPGLIETATAGAMRNQAQLHPAARLG
jgi:hypothetical protein